MSVVFAVLLLVVVALVALATIRDTFRLLRAARDTDRRARGRSPSSEHRRGGRDRSRLAA